MKMKKKINHSSRRETKTAWGNQLGTPAWQSLKLDNTMWVNTLLYSQRKEKMF